jgi:2-amino-4-hydroxy-6-hydroxymethyldihydropteridine diphosphokinase
MHSVYLLTGSNLGNRQEQLNKSRIELAQHAGDIITCSAIYETEAWGIEGLPAHYNQAIHLETSLAPLELLRVIQDIELRLGRVRQERWGVRAIDIDIIYFGDEVLQLPELVIPHPLMQERNFVLAPLTEIAPALRHPLLGKTNLELLQSSPDKLTAIPAGIS